MGDGSGVEPSVRGRAGNMGERGNGKPPSTRGAEEKKRRLVEEALAESRREGSRGQKKGVRSTPGGKIGVRDE